MAIADRVGVMRAGNLEQLDVPPVLYTRPATPFVASFVGTNNVIPTVVTTSGVEVLGRTVGIAPGSDALPVGSSANALVRPESIQLVARDAGGAGAPGTVMTTSFFGSTTRLTVRLESGQSVLVDMPSTVARDFTAGGEVLAHSTTNEVVIQHGEVAVDPDA